jgi:hypothetical protein
MYRLVASSDRRIPRTGSSNELAYGAHVSFTPVVSSMSADAQDGSSLSLSTLEYISDQAKRKGFTNLGGLDFFFVLSSGFRVHEYVEIEK